MRLGGFGRGESDRHGKEFHEAMHAWANCQFGLAPMPQILQDVSSTSQSIYSSKFKSRVGSDQQRELTTRAQQCLELVWAQIMSFNNNDNNNKNSS